MISWEGQQCWTFWQFSLALGLALTCLSTFSQDNHHTGFAAGCYTHAISSHRMEKDSYTQGLGFFNNDFYCSTKGTYKPVFFSMQCAITRHIMTADREGSSLDPWQVSVLLWHGFCSLVNFFLIFLILLAWVGNVSHRSWFRHVVTWLCYIWGDHEAFGTVV